MFKFQYFIFFVLSHSLHGLTILPVSLYTDNNPGGQGNPGDLRYCLNQMNTDLNGGIADDYKITFDSPMTITLNGILPIINNSLHDVNITIGNTGSIPTVTIDGQGIYPGFFIPRRNVTIQNIIFQSLVAQGGDGGDGIAGGGGGMGAGGALYLPADFFNDGSKPSVTLINVSANFCQAIGGKGGNCLNIFSGQEGGGGGGGIAGNGGSITTVGVTGGAGGGGFGGKGGNVTLSDTLGGGGGGGGGGFGSKATSGTPTNLGDGGSDQDIGQPGNGYGYLGDGWSGANGLAGGTLLGGGGGGGGPITTPNHSGGGGGGGGDDGSDGQLPEGTTPPGGEVPSSGGKGGYGGGGGGGGVVKNATRPSPHIDGKGGNGGYGGGGGGGSGPGFYESSYTAQGGIGGVGGGGGSGGVNKNTSNSAFAQGGSSSGGGGGGGGGPSNGVNAPGGQDEGYLMGGNGGAGANNVDFGGGGGGGGGGSGLGGAIFVDSDIELTIQALPGIPTFFNTSNNRVEAGAGGIGGPDAENGDAGRSLGESIFLRSGSHITLSAPNSEDLLTLGDEVSFIDDTNFGAGGTYIIVQGDGTVIYNGTSNYQGSITINSANFKVNATIGSANVSVCRNNVTKKRGTLSGRGSLTGNVFANSGTISPDPNLTLTLGTLTLSSAAVGALGSLVHTEINATGTSLVSVIGNAQLAGILEIDLASDAQPGNYILLTSSNITGTFDSISFTRTTPDYSLSYLPTGAPTFVQFTYRGPVITITPPRNLTGVQQKNNFGIFYELFNTLQWQPSTSENVQGYLIYRNNVLLATVDASTTSYQDHDQPRGVRTVYALESFDEQGNTSDQVTVTIN